jgi:hypothetical protein
MKNKSFVTMVFLLLSFVLGACEPQDLTEDEDVASQSSSVINDDDDHLPGGCSGGGIECLVNSGGATGGGGTGGGGGQPTGKECLLRCDADEVECYGHCDTSTCCSACTQVRNACRNSCG